MIYYSANYQPSIVRYVVPQPQIAQTVRSHITVVNPLCSPIRSIPTTSQIVYQQQQQTLQSPKYHPTKESEEQFMMKSILSRIDGIDQKISKLESSYSPEKNSRTDNYNSKYDNRTTYFTHENRSSYKSNNHRSQQQQQSKKDGGHHKIRKNDNNYTNQNNRDRDRRNQYENDSIEISKSFLYNKEAHPVDIKRSHFGKVILTQPQIKQHEMIDDNKLYSVQQSKLYHESSQLYPTIKGVRDRDMENFRYRTYTKNPNLINESNLNQYTSQQSRVTKINYQDCLYEGGINKDGKREGLGSLFDQEGHLVYCGLWHEDEFHHRGKLVFRNQKRLPLKINIDMFKSQKAVEQFRQSYSGEFKQGNMNGIGQMTFEDNHGNYFIYFGSFRNGIFNGQGMVLQEGTQDTIEGEWNNGTLI